jgi:hypothetical protein
MGSICQSLIHMRFGPLNINRHKRVSFGAFCNYRNSTSISNQVLWFSNQFLSFYVFGALAFRLIAPGVGD